MHDFLLKLILIDCDDVIVVIPIICLIHRVLAVRVSLTKLATENPRVLEILSYVEGRRFVASYDFLGLLIEDVLMQNVLLLDYAIFRDLKLTHGSLLVAVHLLVLTLEVIAVLVGAILPATWGHMVQGTYSLDSIFELGVVDVVSLGASGVVPNSAPLVDL